MNFYYSNTIFDFFDCSIIMPVRNNLYTLSKTLPANLACFQRNGTELIFITNTAGESNELLDLLGLHPFLNYKIILNKQSKEGINAGQNINTGIRYATRKYVFVTIPEIEFVTDVIYQLRYLLTYNTDAYAFGQVTCPNQNWILPYGCFMVEKRFLESINGYAEDLTQQEYTEEGLRARLDLLGLQKIFIPQAEGICPHPPKHTTGRSLSADLYSSIYYPNQIQRVDAGEHITNSKLIYSSSTRTCRKEQCKLYLKGFDAHWTRDDAIFKHRYRIVALVQVRNEIKYLPNVLLHLDKYCDGIILLDDGSTDGSYEAAMSEKLLMKVKKLPEAIFDDLKLRNITLDLAAFINTEWLFFFDADERFHEQYADLYSIANKQDIDSVCFSVVHLWDHESLYKVNLPEGVNGILYRPRMFRNYGHQQIIANRMLHFPATPFQHNIHYAPVLIKHYGNIEPATRKMKYERYTRQDKEGRTQGYTYDYLIEEHTELKPVSNLIIDLFSK